jgi:hypothetical protein
MLSEVERLEAWPMGLKAVVYCIVEEDRKNI